MKKKVLAIIIALVIIVLAVVLVVALVNKNKEDVDDEKEGTSQKQEKKDDNDDENNVESVVREEDDDEKDSNKTNNKTSKKNSVIDEMAEQEAKLFNALFEVYEGEKKGAEIKALLQAVNRSNTSNKDDDERQVTVEIDGEELSELSEIDSASNKVRAAQKYEVSFEYKNNLITKVIIDVI